MSRLYGNYIATAFLDTVELFVVLLLELNRREVAIIVLLNSPV